MTYVGTVPSSVGNPTDFAAVTRALLSTDCGATVDARGHTYTGDGIAVALPEYGMATIGRDPAHVERWVRSVAAHVNADTRRYFGVWVEGGLTYLDAVEVFSSAEEDRALAAARYRGQLAVWHAGRREEVRTDVRETVAAA